LSELGHGSSFQVCFPSTSGCTVAPVPLPTRLHAPVRPHSVLVVEDAPALRDMVRRILSRQGYTVLVATSADEAERVFAAHPDIDILLTDVVMPGASGPELTQRLLDHRPGLKVVYMSGYTDEAIVHHGVINPGIAFLQKPFSAEALDRKLREVLDRTSPP
jgi:two-component system cell cycle sensor histidine kinase/response regulator CckA